MRKKIRVYFDTSVISALFDNCRIYIMSKIREKEIKRIHSAAKLQ